MAENGEHLEQKEGLNSNNENENKEKNQNQEDENKINDKKEEKKMEEEKKEEEEEKKKERSEFSLEGAKPPLSIYTRRVMDISKISEYLKPDSSKGQIGGYNLGNTCFMNSSIACLSNCTELTYYFLKGDYLKDINEENTLGMKGELAKEWGKLLNQYWVKSTSTGDPSDFKSTIGQKAVRFRGYGQQDSNEFMSVFLDIINEDLNKTTKKQYIELKEKSEDETDEQCAKRYWEANLSRNDSIITDLFCGQFKSTITCPNCNFINITFDPFDTINLPLLTQVKRQYYGFGDSSIDVLKFYYIPKNSLRNTYCLMIKDVRKSEILKDIIDRIKKEKDFIYHDKIDDLFMVDMFNKKKYGYAKKTDFIRNYSYSNEYLYTFDFDKNNDEIVFPVYFWEKDDEDSKSDYPRMVFAKKAENLNDLRKRVYFYLRKYILSPFLKENETKDEVSKEIEKYMEDKKNELPDEELFAIVEKEYNEIFKKCDSIEENKEEKDNKKEENAEMTIEEKEKKDEEKKDEEKKEEKKDEEKKEEKKDEEKKEEEQKDKNKKEIIKPELKENKDFLDKFKSDIPFQIYIRKDSSGYYYNRETISLFDSKNFPLYNKKLKDYLDIKKFSTPFDESNIRLNNYELIVKFNQQSKYINKDTFDLNKCDSIEFDYKPKKKEETKKEGEEDELSGKMTLEKCLKKFCREEQLEQGDEWYCSRCKKHVLAKKKMELYYVPKILIICFKRFVKDSYRWEKNEDEVEFPINNLDLKNFVIGPDKEHSKYDLFGVSQHYGSTGFGHYTAVCKNDGKWFDYNDSSCHETNASSAQSSAAYVLFYRRQTD